LVGASKNAHLKALDDAGERLQLLKADLLDYNNVASAVSGCEGVFHVASPVPSGRSFNPEVNLSKTSILYFIPIYFVFYSQGFIPVYFIFYRCFSVVVSRLQLLQLLARLQLYVKYKLRHIIFLKI